MYHNTFLTPGTAVSFSSAASIDDLFTGNLLMAGTASTGTVRNAANNQVVPYAMASTIVRAPMIQLPGLDLYPLAGQAMSATAADLSRVMSDVAALVDFNGTSKGGLLFRGAYAGAGTNPGWAIQEGLKDVTAGGGAAGGGAAGGGAAGGGAAGGGATGGGAAGGGATGGGAAGGGATGGGAGSAATAGGSAGGAETAGGSAGVPGGGGAGGMETPAGCGCSSPSAAPLFLALAMIVSRRKRSKRCTSRELEC